MESSFNDFQLNTAQHILLHDFHTAHRTIRTTGALRRQARAGAPLAGKAGAIELRSWAGGENIAKKMPFIGKLSRRGLGPAPGLPAARGPCADNAQAVKPYTRLGYGPKVPLADLNYSLRYVTDYPLNMPFKHATHRPLLTRRVNQWKNPCIKTR
jgi:hypothetical protein